jgi:hypothetical protein
VAAKKETRFLSPWFLWLRKRNRVSVVEITVNCGSQKRNPVSESLVFVPRGDRYFKNEIGDRYFIGKKGDRYFMNEIGDRFFAPKKKPGFCWGNNS